MGSSHRRWPCLANMPLTLGAAGDGEGRGHHQCHNKPAIVNAGDSVPHPAEIASVSL